MANHKEPLSRIKVFNEAWLKTYLQCAVFEVSLSKWWIVWYYISFDSKGGFP
jgi:hypothetical protein